MTPDLNSIFALRLAASRKLMLIAMIHRARDGWYRGNGSDLAHDAQIDTSNAAANIHRMEQIGLIVPSPDNKPRGTLRAWRIDPKFILDRKDIAA